MRTIGGRLGAIAVGALGATLAACLGSSSNGSNEDSGGVSVPDAGGLPFVDGAGADAGGVVGVEAGPDADAGSGSGGDAGPSCGTNNGGCPANSTCVIDAGVVCVCNPGYSGAACASDCLANHGGCDTNATCSIGASGVVCTCNPGFSGSGTSCAGDDYTQWPAPPDDPPETEYTVSADGVVVIDAVTKLVWQRQLFANPCPGDGAGACTWPDASTYCGSLNAMNGGAGLEGVTGWRVPTLVELLSIVNYGDGAPAIDTALFPATPAVTFWTHTANAASAGQAWGLSFANGFNATQAETTASNVRCVTSNRPVTTTPTCGTVGLACCYANGCAADLACSASSTCSVDSTYVQSVLPPDTPVESSYTVSPGGSVVTDGVTGLVWQRQVLGNPCPSDAFVTDAGVPTFGCTAQDAQTLCSSLDGLKVGGYSGGWRVPSVTELLSIASYTATPLIDPAPFSNPPSSAFWSATPNASSAGSSWSVSYVDGSATPQTASSLLGVRCVNSGGVTPAAEGCGALGQACCYASTCAATLRCASSMCVTDTNYELWTPPPDAPPAVSSDGGPPEYAVSGPVVTDTVTGLSWAGGGSSATQAAAASACAATSAGGFATGWRLPSVVELLSIVDYGVSSGPTVDASVFTAITASPYWTSTAGAGTTTEAWSLTFATGFTSLATTTTTMSFVCVH